MEIQMGVIRDKQGIYAGLLQSQATARQLAVCYNSEGKLIVKICTVTAFTGGQDDGRVTLRTQPDDPATETAIPLSYIQSIYPISDFVK